MSNQRDDVTSDPSLDDDPPADWASEGGAVPEGPATDTDADDTDDRDDEDS